MSRNRQKHPVELGAHIGSASVVMIFAVLCLTIFAALSFVTANAEYRLANKTAESAEAYYTADSEAEERCVQIYALLAEQPHPDLAAEKLRAMDVHMTQTDAGYRLEYCVPIDAVQVIEVMLLWHRDTAVIQKWSITTTAQWDNDEHLQVWDGTVRE